MKAINFKGLIGAVLLSAGMFGAGAAFTPGASAAIVVTNPVLALRGERGSAVNLLQVRQRLDRMIDQLGRDRRDYGGHRVAAIADIQQARAQIQAAIDYDTSHSH